MTMLKALRGSAILLACLGLFTPQYGFAAGPVQANLTGQTLADVALDGSGHLQGQVTDTKGQSVAGAVVLIKHQNQVLAAAKTNEAGRFAIAGLTGGVYQLQTQQGNSLCRVWSDGTAPPAAHQQALVVDGPTVLGQGCDACGGGGCDTCCGGGGGGGFAEILTSPWAIAAIGATAIALPLALDDSGS